MRKIEQEMLNAVNYGRNWCSGNTQVCHVNGVAYVYLHGHNIANVYGEVEVNRETLAEWPTRTTMSRLRALGADVCTKKGVVMLNGEPL